MIYLNPGESSFERVILDITMKKNNDYTVGSGNVFADLGLPNPEERLAKAELARQINKLIKQQKMTQVEAAELLDIDQPKVSSLHKGKLAGFSLERLFRFLNILGQNIIIQITPKSRSTKKAYTSIVIPKSVKKPLKKPKNSTGDGVALHAKKKK